MIESTALEKFAAFFSQVGGLVWGVVIINLLLIVFAKPLVRLVFSDSQKDSRSTRRLHIFRVLNLLIIACLGYLEWFKGGEEQTIAIKLLAIVVIVYLAYLLGHLLNYLILRRYGRERSVEGETRLVETYNARILTLFGYVFIFIIGLITVIRLLGFSSLLEAGGVIGLIGVFLALTQAAWAPDIFSGLIILNSNMLEEGDVIELRGGEYLYGVVYKTKIFHTEVLNLLNNHRIMIRNARLRDQIIHNLSKFASAKGLRECLNFKIGYDVTPASVKSMFNAAWDQALQSNPTGLQAQHALEFGVKDAGDHAVQWSVYYHTKAPEHLLRTRMELNQIFLETASQHGISLSTPMTHVVNEIQDAIDA